MEKEESCDVSGKPQTHLQLAALSFSPSAISSMGRMFEYFLILPQNHDIFGAQNPYLFRYAFSIATFASSFSPLPLEMISGQR